MKSSSTTEVAELASMLLRNLGDSTSQVAAQLGAREIAGVRNTVRELNPLVRFVWGHLPEALQVDVIVPGFLRMSLPGDRKESVPLPAPVTAFLEAFNRGLFPELEARGECA